MDKPLVRVTWLDASDPNHETSWYSDADVDKFSAEECKVVSVGWLKSRTKQYVTLCADFITEEDNSTTWGRPTKIPIGMIVSTEEING